MVIGRRLDCGLVGLLLLFLTAAPRCATADEAEPPPLPTATPASTPTQEIWIAVRTDELPGSGTQVDPYNGNTPERFDTLLHSFYNTPNLGIHLMGTGPFRT